MEENMTNETGLTVGGNTVNGLEAMRNSGRNVNQKIFTTITDEKLLFNLDTHCDFKINDCVGETIRVKDMLCKVIEKQLKEAKIDEETGEIKDKEYTMITILVDDKGKSYVTASKSFYFQFKKLCDYYTEEKIKGGIDIKFINVPVKNSTNKALGFELV